MAEIRRGTPTANVYTVLLLIALIALLAGVVYVWYRSAELFGAPNPFAIAAGPALRAVGLA